MNNGNALFNPDVNAGWQQNPAFIDPMRAPANPVQQILQQNR